MTSLSSSLLTDNIASISQITLVIQTPLHPHLAENIAYISLACNGHLQDLSFDVVEAIILLYLKF